MPVCADPDETIKFSLAGDLQIPEDKRPTFLIKFLTQREASKITRALTDAEQVQIVDDATLNAHFDKVSEALMIGLAGWQNMTYRGELVSFPTPLPEFLHTAEIRELIEAVQTLPRLTIEDKKKSSSLAIIEPAKSATDAKPPESA